MQEYCVVIIAKKVATECTATSFFVPSAPSTTANMATCNAMSTAWSGAEDIRKGEVSKIR